MTRIRSICVYCGSRSGKDERFSTLARDFGHMMAANNISLVYGGGSIGLMGVVARAVMEHGGKAIGVIPRHLDQVEITQKDLSELHVVEDMHTRKRKMFDLSDAFVSLPGSIGTLDETIENYYLAQLGLHDKPVLLVNEQNYWDPFLTLMSHMCDNGFASPHLHDLFEIVDSIHNVMPTLQKLPDPETASKNRLF